MNHTLTEWLSCEGRGLNYTHRRGLEENILRALYRRGWPARLWRRVPGSAQVQRHHYRFALLPPGTPPLRLGFVSDLHIGPTTPCEVLDRAFDQLVQARPDVLLLGGDYVFLNATPRRARRLRELVDRVPTPHRYAVLGNHDLWCAHALLEQALTDIGVRFVINEVAPLPRPWSSAVVAGLDDPWAGTPDPTAIAPALATARVRIGLAHAPEILPRIGPLNLDLLFVGHTHGGQIALPGGHPIVAPGAMSWRYAHGLHDIDGTRLITSRGLGGVETAVRLFAPPDVVIVDLQPHDAPSADPRG